MGLGSGIRKKPIPDPGSRGHKVTGSRIRIRNIEETYKKNSHPRSFCPLKDLYMLQTCVTSRRPGWSAA
jgi:hypothetical protein